MKKLALIGIALITIYYFLFFVVFKYFYCKWKFKNPPKRKCFFWDCAYYSTCPYNFKLKM